MFQVKKPTGGIGLTRRKLLLSASCAALAACTPRGALGVRTDFISRNTESVWVIAIGDQQPIAVHGTSHLQERAFSRFARFDVSIPERREIGEITWPRETIDPDRHFYVAAFEEMDHVSGVLDQVEARLGPEQNVVVFIHGYNTNYAEAVYRHAQIAHDFGDTEPQISIIWPSEASATGYLTDRDTALIARDQLERLLPQLTRRFPGRVLLAAHSMGAFLTMETLRQMSMTGQDITQDLAALVLVSPDIRIDVFQSQVARMAHLPEITFVILSQRDRALRLSSRLAGGKPRLGSAADIEVLSDMDLLVVDLSDLPDSGGSDHLAMATSPAAVAFIRGLDRQNPVLRDRRGSGLLVLRVPLPIPR